MIAVVACRVGGARFAVALADVHEVVMLPELAPLPEAPAYVLGVLDLRGEALPVLDLAARVLKHAPVLRLTDQVIICADGSRRVGLKVEGVERVEERDVAPVPAEREVPHAPYVVALLHDADDGLLMLLSVRELLAHSEVPDHIASSAVPR